VHYLISGLAKSGTTRLFSQISAALEQASIAFEGFFEPETDEDISAILASKRATLSKVLIGRVKPEQSRIAEFSRHVLIYRDPRDQFISMLLYLFYDFQLSGDREGYQRARAALTRKVESPASVSTIALYDELAALVGRGPIQVFARLHALQRRYREVFAPFALRYEDLISGAAMRELEAYLGLSLSGEVEVSPEYSRVVRSKGFGEWRHWLNAEDLRYVNEHWGSTMDRLGYETVTEPGDLVIETRLSLDYVSQFEPGG
jgi:hypothetical protein